MVEIAMPAVAYVALRRPPAQSKAYWKPALVSALEGSNCALKLIVAGLASFTGPLFESVAVGPTLLIVTAAVYSLTPPSLSLTLPLTVRLPLSVVGQFALFEPPKAP